MTPADRLVLGTAGLTLSYGGQPGLTFQEVSTLFSAATAAGIRRLDTAPSYANEAVIGVVAPAGWQVATKLDCLTLVGSKSTTELRYCIEKQLDASRQDLHRETLPVVFVHNPTAQFLAESPIIAMLKMIPWVERIGASVYGLDEVQVAANRLSLVQVPVSLLDQRMIPWLSAKPPHLEVWARSVLMRGALTTAVMTFPPTQWRVQAAARLAMFKLGCASWEQLTCEAIRFVAGVPGVDRLVLGLRSSAELDVALKALGRPMPPYIDTAPCASTEVDVIDIRRWDRAG